MFHVIAVAGATALLIVTRLTFHNKCWAFGENQGKQQTTTPVVDYLVLVRVESSGDSGLQSGADDIQTQRITIFTYLPPVSDTYST